MRARLHQRMDLPVPELFDVLILQSFQYLRLLHGQAIFGRHSRDVINQANAQILFEPEIVEDLVQFVCRWGGMLVEFVAARTSEFVRGRGLGAFLGHFAGSLVW